MENETIPTGQRKGFSDSFLAVVLLWSLGFIFLSALSTYVPAFIYQITLGIIQITLLLFFFLLGYWLFYYKRITPRKALSAYLLGVLAATIILFALFSLWLPQGFSQSQISKLLLWNSPNYLIALVGYFGAYQADRKTTLHKTIKELLIILLTFLSLWVSISSISFALFQIPFTITAIFGGPFLFLQFFFSSYLNALAFLGISLIFLYQYSLYRTLFYSRILYKVIFIVVHILFILYNFFVAALAFAGP